MKREGKKAEIIKHKNETTALKLFFANSHASFGGIIETFVFR